jgi:hypothetical protein
MCEKTYAPVASDKMKSLLDQLRKANYTVTGENPRWTVKSNTVNVTLEGTWDEAKQELLIVVKKKPALAG